MMIVKISDATCISEICWKQLPAAEQRKGEGRDGEPEPGHEEGAGSDPGRTAPTIVSR